MQGQTNQYMRREQRQRQLRNAPPDAESRPWQQLRRRQIDNQKFRRQHPYGNFILDSVCLARQVVVELDGSKHANARAYHAMRTEFLEQRGFVVPRSWNNAVLEDIEGVVAATWQVVVSRHAPSPPNSPLEGGLLTVWIRLLSPPFDGRLLIIWIGVLGPLLKGASDHWDRASARSP